MSPHAQRLAIRLAICRRPWTLKSSSLSRQSLGSDHRRSRFLEVQSENTYPRWPDQYSSTDGQRKFQSAKYAAADRFARSGETRDGARMRHSYLCLYLRLIVRRKPGACERQLHYLASLAWAVSPVPVRVLDGIPVKCGYCEENTATSAVVCSMRLRSTLNPFHSLATMLACCLNDRYLLSVSVVARANAGIGEHAGGSRLLDLQRGSARRRRVFGTDQ